MICQACNQYVGEIEVWPVHCACGTVHRDDSTMTPGGQPACRAAVSPTNYGPCVHRSRTPVATIPGEWMSCGCRNGALKLYDCAVYREAILERRPTMRAFSQIGNTPATELQDVVQLLQQLQPSFRGRVCLGCRHRTAVRSAKPNLDRIIPAAMTVPTTRHLIYHVYASRANDLWRKNVAAITKRADLFNGSCYVAVATDETTHSFADVAYCFPSHWNLIEMPNDPRLREVATFRPLLDRVQHLGETDAIFYAHTKGNTTAIPNDSRESAESRHRGVRLWTATMYQELLDDWDRIAQALTNHAAVGTTLLEGAFRYPSGLSFPDDFWMFAGTFFWFRPDVLFRLNWKEIADDRYGAEAWLGGILPIEAIKSVFQPWPPRVWPEGSPYDPRHYDDPRRLKW